jgi:hypothetical protein
MQKSYRSFLLNAAQILVYACVVWICSLTVLYAQESTDAASEFNQGISALEKQNFRAATDAFRSAYLLDSANMTYLRHLAKALFYAEFKNLDSVRFAQYLLLKYNARGGEANPLLAEKGKILTNDVNARVDVLVEDSLRTAQRLATRYVSPYQYSYRATAEKPKERPKDSLSLVGKSIWTASLLIQAGVMLQPNQTFDHWGEGALSLRAAFWGRLSDGMDIGGEGGIMGAFGAMLESGSIPAVSDNGRSLRRTYVGEATARLRFHFHGLGVVSVGAFGHLENAQTLGFTPERVIDSVLVGTPFNLLGAGLAFEPREGAEGLILSGRYYFFPFLGTTPLARMITANVGYSFGRAALVLEGIYAERTVSANLPTTTIAARVGLHWHFLQAVSVRKDGE